MKLKAPSEIFRILLLLKSKLTYCGVTEGEKLKALDGMAVNWLDAKLICTVDVITSEEKVKLFGGRAEI